MQAITQNRITQGQHGTSKAVDYSAKPDPIIYAPEDGTIESYQQRGSGKSDAGLALRMRGASGRLHQFAHTERSLVPVGAKVKRGQPIAVMGYTGYTIPSGPNGAHVHWWVITGYDAKGNAIYAYPPSLINQSFIKGEVMAADKLTKEEVIELHAAYFGGKPGAGYDYRHVGGTLQQLISDWKPGTLVGQVDAQAKTIKIKDGEITRLNKEIESLKAQVGDNSKWETFKALIRELIK